MQRTLEKFDLFGAPIPGFNIKGKTEARTYSGGLLSLLISTVVLMFAVIKFLQLIDRYNPNISQVLQKSYYTENDLYNTRENNFRLAFSLENYIDGKVRLDPKYVKPFLRIFNEKNGVEDHKEILSYPCTDADLDKFYPVAKYSEYILSKYRSDGDPGK